MEFFWSDREINYDGTQLRSHWAYETFGLLGDSCVGFLGPCEVSLEKMVDLEDVRNHSPIASRSMLHFILEDFRLDLSGGVLLQRLLVAQLLEFLLEKGISGGQRRGDDLYWKEKKLNVSVATRSPVSTLIHLALNVETEGTPVPTVGLKDWKIDPVKFGKELLERFRGEWEGVRRATWKVRPVD